MKVTIAALLHDIGKFYQRAEKSLGDNSVYQKYIKDDGYIHSAFTAKFFNEKLNNNLPDFDNVLHLSAGHHIDELSEIKKANIIATGHDRKDLSGVNYDVPDYEKNNDLTKKMNIIFNEVNLDKESSSYNELSSYNEPSSYNESSSYNKLYELNLTKLSDLGNTEESLVKDKEKTQKEYKVLFDLMLEEIEEMNRKGYNSYEELHQYLYPILKEYTVTIPSSTFNQKVSTVSLFDHSKLTCAIANCQKYNKSGIFAFVNYDISGIQKFIYKVAEGKEAKPKVAKSLRTRSFYLSVLTDFVAYYIVNEFGLTYENVLYSSGGRGRILVPYSDDINDRLVNINKKIESSMFDMHSCEISFSIAYSKVNDEELVKSNISDFMRDGLTIISEKSKKFKSIISNSEFSAVSASKDTVCILCNNNSKVDSDGICGFCNKLLKINDLLVKENKFIVEYNYDLNNNVFSNSLSYENSLNIKGLGNIIFHNVSKFTLDRPKSYYLSINCHKIGESKTYAKSNIGGKSFEDIAKNSVGDQKIAAIKMDVDNLGFVFLKGIKKDNETISKNLTLSRMMDYFFTKKLVEICNKEEYKKSIYINYAGGDDLVLISPASMALNLVRDINSEFEIFTGYNKSLHISAGIEIFSPTTPVRYEINIAEDYLSQSKLTKDKNSFTMLGVSLPNSEINKVLEDIRKFEDGLNNETLSRTGLYEIYTYILRGLEVDDVKGFMHFIPLIAYSIKRNMNDYWMNILKKIFVVQDIKRSTLEYYKVVFTIALMKTRKNDN